MPKIQPLKDLKFPGVAYGKVSGYKAECRYEQNVHVLRQQLLLNNV